MSASNGSSVARFEFDYAGWVGSLLGILGLGRRTTRIDVDDNVMIVTFGWGFRSAVPRASIISAAPYDGRVLRWGVHGWGGSWMVNGSSKGIVEITISPGCRGRVMGLPVTLKRLSMSVIDRDALIAHLVG